ncbi:putative RING-H2 finger protein ATL21A isoform X2 [Phaseolus vulgaris]|uniref:putative RING-H2 finger protein ATL21A isoform X2 n=1 Tax=Phaseolus vulgaris TaxID=3885 RepID=UPI0035C9483F
MPLVIADFLFVAAMVSLFVSPFNKKIQVYDPDDCLPKRLLSLNVSASPFSPTFTRNYTFLSCPLKNAGSQFIPIDCLSNSTHFVSAVLSLSLPNPLPASCHVITSLFVPVAGPEQRFEGNFKGEFSEDLALTWDRPDCRYCEAQEQLCGFDRNNNNQLFCFSYQTGASKQGIQIFRIITLSVVGPAAIFAIVMACCVCYKDRLTNIRNNAIARSAPATILPAPEIVTTGLDESTIESYEKVVLGESRRVPGPNNGCCWICLSEYNSKETIRCIPECEHCFHADCIDEWLRINTTCPVCRNSPSPSPSPRVTSINP